MLRAEGDHLNDFVEDANKRVVLNILKSYAGYFDVFSEPIQNALDAVSGRVNDKKLDYDPTIWIEINLREKFIRVVDNGVGMSEREFKFCLCPNISFKRGSGQRGNKGVGATFLAYGFSQLEMHSRDRDGDELAARLRNGRSWANDNSGSIPRPTLEEMEYSIPELRDGSSGTSVKIILGGATGERPKDLGWLGATTADQWFDILRIKSPLGGIYIKAASFKPRIFLKVIAQDGAESNKESRSAEYLYPHELPVVNKVQDLSSINKAQQKIDGDFATQRARLGNEFKRLDCIYEIWDKSSILAEDSPFYDIAQDDQYRELIERHSITVYGAFLCSAKLWTKYLDEHLKVRRTAKIVHGGLQLACDQMVQGDLYVIPLTSAIGYQANAHIIVHFSDGNPDMGRKVFQPELKTLADAFGVRAVTTFKKYLALLRSDVGAGQAAPTKALWDWKTAQVKFRDSNGLAFNFGGRELSLVSAPQQEQDVVALFHELLGHGALHGYRILATSSHDRYDSLFVTYNDRQRDSFSDSIPLGVSVSSIFGQESEPKVLEYKYDFEDLVDDFSKDVKSSQDIALAVAWRADKSEYGNLYLKSLLIGDEGADRMHFGATHQAYYDGHPNMAFEIIVLRDLLAFIQDPATERARHRSLYK